MNLVRGALHPFRLPLRNAIETAHGPIGDRIGWVVALENAAGDRGLGEATPLPDFGTESVDAASRALEGAIQSLFERPIASLEAALECVASSCIGAPCAAAALETALFDLAAREQGQAVSTFLERRVRETGAPSWASNSPSLGLAVQALIGGADPDRVRVAATAAREAGFEHFKMKLATEKGSAGISASRSGEASGLEVDLARVSALREAVGPASGIRLDANGAWTRPEAEDALRALSAYDIDYVEQPVGAADLDGLAALSREAPIAVAADEALLGDGLEACLADRIASIFIIKPAALGGFSTLARMAPVARAAGIRLVFSTLMDGAISRASAAHATAALAAEGEVHGLATGSALAMDLAEMPEPMRGWLPHNEGPGLGSLFDDLEVGERDSSRSTPWTGGVTRFGAPA